MKKLKVTKTTTEEPLVLSKTKIGDPDNNVWGDDPSDRFIMPTAMQQSYKKIHKELPPKGTTVSQVHIDRWKKDNGMVSTNFDVIEDDPKPVAKAAAKPKPKPAVKQGTVGKLKTKPVENISNNTTSTDRNPMPMQQPVESSTFSTKDEKMLGKRSGMKKPLDLSRGWKGYKPKNRGFGKL
tara:strand:- start:7 stop:549 length:543 start_codon:yes stop_codon:yes gene_type:complete